MLTAAQCATASGVYLGNSAPCAGTAENPITCCPANFNQLDGVNATDIFIFLDAWFGQNGQTGPGLTADFNNSEAVNATDIFTYLDAWFNGC